MSIVDKVNKFYNDNINGFNSKEELEERFFNFVDDECEKYMDLLYPDKEKHQYYKDLQKIDIEYDEDNDKWRDKKIYKVDRSDYREKLIKEFEYLMHTKDYQEIIYNILHESALNYINKGYNKSGKLEINKYCDIIYKHYLKTSQYVNRFYLPPFDETDFKDKLINEINALQDYINIWYNGNVKKYIDRSKYTKGEKVN